MEVVNRELPSHDALAYKLWHLLRESDTFFIYVNCEQSAAGFPALQKLNASDKLYE